MSVVLPQLFGPSKPWNWCFFKCKRVVLSRVRDPYARPNSARAKSGPGLSSHSWTFGADATLHFERTAGTTVASFPSSIVPARAADHSDSSQHAASDNPTQMPVQYSKQPFPSATPFDVKYPFTTASDISISSICLMTLHNSVYARSHTARASGSLMPSFSFSRSGFTLGMSGRTSRGFSTSLHMFSMMMQHLRLTSTLSKFNPRTRTGMRTARAGASTSCTKTQLDKDSIDSAIESGCWMLFVTVGMKTSKSLFPEQWQMASRASSAAAFTSFLTSHTSSETAGSNSTKQAPT